MHITTTNRSGVVARFAASVVAGIALVIGAVLALVFAASVALVSLMAAVLLSLAFGVMKARRAATVRASNGVIEARRVGHSWVAYGWDQRR